MSFDKGLGSLQWIRRNSSHLGSSQLWLPSLGSSSRLAAQAGPLFFGMQRAEAGMFSGLTDAFKHDATKLVKDTIKEQVNKALQINFDGMDSRRNDMIHHLRLACGWFGSSEYKIMGATQSASQSDMQAYGVLVNSLLNNNSGSMDEVYTLTSTPRPSKEKVQAGLQQMMSSGDKQAQEDAKQKMSWAKGDNARALLFCGLAARDVAFLTSETAKGLKDAKNLDDIKSRLNKYTDAIKDAKSVISMIQSSIKNRNDARKAYDKANNIKAPSSKDVKASVNALDAE